MDRHAVGQLGVSANVNDGVQLCSRPPQFVQRVPMPCRIHLSRIVANLLARYGTKDNYISTRQPGRELSGARLGRKSECAPPPRAARSLGASSRAARLTVRPLQVAQFSHVGQARPLVNPRVQDAVEPRRRQHAYFTMLIKSVVICNRRGIPQLPCLSHSISLLRLKTTKLSTPTHRS